MMMPSFPDIPKLAHIGLPPAHIGHVPVHPVTLSSTLNFIDGVIQDDRYAVIHYANAHAINLAERNIGFRQAMTEASLVFCDGKSLQWAARLLGHELPQRFTPPDWVDDLCSLAEDRGYRMFFLGGAPSVAEAAADRLRGSHPGLHVGTEHGFFTRGTSEEKRVVSVIRQYAPQILLVGFGMPEQERWAREYGPLLEANVLMTVGGMFDYVSGTKRRGPRWLNAIGLEWLTRLFREPRRLGSRYTLGNLTFIWTILRQGISRYLS